MDGRTRLYILLRDGEYYLSSHQRIKHASAYEWLGHLLLPVKVYDKFFLAIEDNEKLTKDLTHSIQYPEYVSKMVMRAISDGDYEDTKYLRIHRTTFRSTVRCVTCECKTRALYGMTEVTSVCYRCIRSIYERIHGWRTNDEIALENSIKLHEFIDHIK